MPSEKLSKAAASQLDDLKMDMSPMIDLVFLLLIFFMVASNIIIIPLDEAVNPPIAVKAEATDAGLGRIPLNIRENGEVTGTNPDRPLATADGDLSEVEAYIGKLADEMKAVGDDPKLHIRADINCKVKRIREVVEAGANAGVSNVIFAAYQDPNQYAK